MQQMRRPGFLLLILYLTILLFRPGSPARAESIPPAHLQEFRDAGGAIAAAEAAQAEKFAPEPLRQAREFLAAAEAGRSSKDAVKFSQASRLSRAYAELARAVARLKAEEGKLAEARDELVKARAELEAVKRKP